MKESYQGTRTEVDRAIRRLQTLETLILGAIVLVALVGGAVVAYLLHLTLELPFRTTWVVLSLLLFGIPGAWVVFKERKESRQDSLHQSRH
ncbi:MAG: hypothetical protein WEA09_10270 [Gemmatimonadota bacterium]